ncbi:MAG TPA: Rieske 2Fe-2S domain-containing protein [Candidatus Binatia bacterium]|jgi:phenylpropionate dioxygenase-like ring-hydroxylating dioxygenase large terminal subunit
MKVTSAKKKNKPVTLGAIPRVGSGTPAGEWLRKYWLVVGAAAELHDIPKAVKVLGEELVLFRDPKGRIGLLGLHCPHRGTSLEYGDIEDRGIRCAYHGWLFDVSGQCLEQPAEPKDSVFCQKVKHLSYPVRELGGLVFAYLGPHPEKPPPLPRYSCLVDRGGERQIEPVRYNDYNWFNFFENSADPCHICILHRHTGYGEQSWGDQFFSYEEMPDFEYVETDYGMKVVMTKPGPSPGTEFVDTMTLALPSIIQVGDTEFVHARVDAVKLMTEGSQCEHVLFLTPNDDQRFTIFTVNYYTGSDPNFFEKLKRMRATEVPKQEVKEYDRRKYMPFKGNVRQEDIMSQSTQGFLGERAERLATSDRGVIMFRKIVRGAIVAALKGDRPKGVVPKGREKEIVYFDSFTGVRKSAAR